MARELRRMEIEPAENGGHTVTHHFKEERRNVKSPMVMGTYHEPESHVFGPEDGHEMLAHVANHLGIQEEEGESTGDDETGGKAERGGAQKKMGHEAASRVREKVGRY